jgi:predicted transcriptional regulator
MLELTRKITSLTYRGFITYFQNQENMAEIDRKILGHLQNETKAKIFCYLRYSPGSSRKLISDRLGISGPAVTWHMRQLVNDQIVIAKTDGKFVRYSLNPDGVSILETRLPTVVDDKSG